MAELTRDRNPSAGRGTIRDHFRRFAAAASAAAGSVWAFLGAAGFLVIWVCSYPLFLRLKDPLDTWQLVINTATTIITFLMVFLIQNGQNRDAKALHLKLDELIRAVKGARNHLVDLEECTDEELDELKKEFNRIRRKEAPRAQAKAEKLAANVEMEQQHRTV
ncbi:MAG TPA: low affinity iron permease family protein [Phycisphaerae bacterium]|nr:low affinity iron permease family protein [Phycisphaerae bacterium]